MPFEFRFETHHAPVACVRGWNTIDDASWRSVMEVLRTDPRFQPDTVILLDLRDASNAPSPGAAPMLAGTWKAAAAGHRVAILTEPDTVAYGIARQVGALTDDQICVYTELAEALRAVVEQKPIADD